MKNGDVVRVKHGSGVNAGEMGVIKHIHGSGTRAYVELFVGSKHFDIDELDLFTPIDTFEELVECAKRRLEFLADFSNVRPATAVVFGLLTYRDPYVCLNQDQVNGTMDIDLSTGHKYTFNTSKGSFGDLKIKVIRKQSETTTSNITFADLLAADGKLFNTKSFRGKTDFAGRIVVKDGIGVWLLNHVISGDNSHTNEFFKYSWFVDAYIFKHFINETEGFEIIGKVEPIKTIDEEWVKVLPDTNLVKYGGMECLFDWRGDSNIRGKIHIKNSISLSSTSSKKAAISFTKKRERSHARMLMHVNSFGLSSTYDEIASIDSGYTNVRIKREDYIGKFGVASELIVPTKRKQMSVEEFEQGRKAIFLNERQHKILKAKTSRLTPYRGDCYYINNTYWSSNNEDIVRSDGYEIINFLDFDFHEESPKTTKSPFPERWSIKTTKENYKEVGHFFNIANREHPLNCYLSKEYLGSYFHSHNLSNGNSIFAKEPNSYFVDKMHKSGHLPITIDMFREIVKENAPTYRFVEHLIEKDTFILPKEWFVRPKTLEQSKVMEKWRGGGYHGEMGTVALIQSKQWVAVKYLIKSYTEITFEQFQKYVLKESTEQKPFDNKVLNSVYQPIKQSQNVDSKRAIVQGVNLEISTGNRVRGLGLEIPRSKIIVGDHSSDHKKRLSASRKSVHENKVGISLRYSG